MDPIRQQRAVVAVGPATGTASGCLIVRGQAGALRNLDRIPGAAA